MDIGGKSSVENSSNRDSRMRSRVNVYEREDSVSLSQPSRTEGFREDAV